MPNSPLKLSAPWEEVKEKIKERNLELTDDDLDYVEGNEEALLETLARKMKRNKEEVRQYIESISHNRDIAS